MNILVTGANGQLGRELRILAGQSPHRFLFTDISQASGLETIPLDITNPEAIQTMVIENHVEVVINCAAYTNVDGAETDQVRARQLNAEAPLTLARVMQSVGGLLVHISTDYVFGKEPYNVPCREEQSGTPTGVYGRTKLQGEQNILSSGCRYIIIRTAWLYSEFGKNFCKTMLALVGTKSEVKVVFDQVGTPTYAYDLARAILEILESRKALSNPGIYHYSNEGVCSWYDFAKMIAEYSGHTQCLIHPCHSSEYPSPVVRPSYSVLDKTKIKSVFGVSVPYWTDSLRVCIHNLLKQS